MILLDTDVAIDPLRKHAPAIAWMRGIGTAAFALPGLVVTELLQGCRNKTEQQRVEQFCMGVNVHWPTALDCERSLHDYALFHLSHNLGVLDALIAHTAVGLGETLATFNLKHYGVIAGLKTIQPY